MAGLSYDVTHADDDSQLPYVLVIQVDDLGPIHLRHGDKLEAVLDEHAITVTFVTE